MKKIGALIRGALVRIVVSLPDPVFYRYKYFVLHRQLCHFHPPRRFSEKIFHRMRYPRPVFSELADKVAVRDYIASTAGPQYLVPAYFSCEQVTLDTFDRLPEAFVMKANNSAGQVRIVRSKHSENLAELVALADTWLTSNFPLRMREKHYRYIQARIIFEQALLTDGQPPADYKFSVFNRGRGEQPYVFIQYMRGRFENLVQDLYLDDWSPAPFKLSHQRTIGSLAPRPEKLDEMLAIAKKLASPFGYLRVDFYLHDGRVYVGELTVTPGAGGYAFDPPEWDEVLGERFEWPERSFGDELKAGCADAVTGAVGGGAGSLSGDCSPGAGVASLVPRGVPAGSALMLGQNRLPGLGHTE